MELKPYQKNVISDLVSYISKLIKTKDIAKAFIEHWQEKGVHTGPLPGQMQSYKNTIPKVPHVCLKVPTAGGKTFIACNALKEIFSITPAGIPKVVIWLVPSRTILEQTIKNLRNVDHPYRQKVNTHFNGRVEIYDKDQLLQGANFNSTTVKEQLSICILTFDSLRAKNKEDRKINQENGNLSSFALEGNQNDILEGVDETSLSQVIYQLNPVCVVDESHNAETDLSIEMLKNLNPRFILDLTATPRDNSNIISFIDAFQLKKENMVKLPVIVYNHNKKEEVISDALQLQKNLEQKAKEEEKISGKYIRPIVLFQAEPKNAKDTATFETIKNKLIELGIPQNQIAIKTAKTNEIKNIDLLSKDCEIRFIITINALKEGWDCPFAYILASLANKSSAVDVEQILGRILRQPYVTKHNDYFLNLSYVFTASSVFQDTLENIVKGLQKSGFSKDDYRVFDESEDTTHIKNTSSEEIAASQDLFGNIYEKKEDEEDFKIEDISLPQESNTSTSLEKIEEQARQESEKFEKEIKNTEDCFSDIPSSIRKHMKQNTIRNEYIKITENIKIPQFVSKKISNDLFSSGVKESFLLEKQNLLGGFRLENADINIAWEYTESDIYKVDIEENDTSPKYQKTARATNKILLNEILKLPEKRQIENITDIVFQAMGKTSNALSDSDVRAYVERSLKSLFSSNKEIINDCIENPNKYARKIKEKIKMLSLAYSSKIFYEQIDADKILTKESYVFHKEGLLPKEPVSIIKSLYQEEGDINGFERKVINEIANYENIIFWHRNPEKKGKGFYINGSIHHYPDFIVQTKKGKIIIIETKGDDRDNSDSEEKLKLGITWANKAGESYKYFMVFDKNSIEGAYNFSEFLEIIKEL